MAKIYVSSTYLDLQEFREKILFHLQRMKQSVTSMEYYLADDRRPADKCIADVEACDIYVGIFAWRYGTLPKENNPKRLSITEMEYRKARDKKIPCLIFLHDDKSPWPPMLVDESKKRILKFRKELEQNHTPQWFKNADELVSLVGASLYDKLMELGLRQPYEKGIIAFDLEKYYQALRKRYQTLALEGLTPPQKEEYLQIHLRSVFVEQNVRESPPPVELPKEVWDKLQRDKDVHPEDLPSGITFDDVRRARDVYFEKPSRPVLDVLTDARHQQTIILGDPGSGKSTLARYIMLSLIDPSTSLRTGPTSDEKIRQKFNCYLPLLIELRTYTGACLEGNCGTFLEFFEYLGKTEGYALTKDALHNHLKNDGRAFVIFDGLDEIFDPEKREQITRQIVGFANDYQKVRIVVTSRVIGYRRKILTDAGFTHFTLQDLDEKQVEMFVNRWYDLALSDQPDEAKERKERILKSFKDSPSIRQLAGNPMLLTIMAIIGKHQELPRERWKLYDHAASVLIQHWDVNKHLKDQRVDADFIGEDDKKELLRRLAFKMQSAKGGLAGNYIHREELQSEFEGYLIERFSQTPERAKIIAEMMIQQFRERNFILSLYGANLYGFVHRAFLEFFCASAFVYKFEKTKELTIEQLKTEVYGKHWEDQSWHEVLRLICGMIDEKWAGRIIDYLAIELYQPWPAKFEDRPPWNIALAVQCLAEKRNTLLRTEYSRSLLRVLCSLIERSIAGDLSIHNYIASYILPSVESIGSIWNDGNIIYDWLSDLRSNNNSWASSKIFGEFVGCLCKGQNLVLEMLLKYYHHTDKNYRVLSPFALAKGWTDDPVTHSLIRDLAINDPDAKVRSEALAALAEHYNNSNTLLLLKNFIKNDEQHEVLETAVWSIAKYFHNSDKIIDYLCSLALSHKSEIVRYKAVDMLAEEFHNKPEVFTFLCDLITNASHPELKDAAIFGLAEYFTDQNDILSLLYNIALSHKDDRARAIATLAISKHYYHKEQTLDLMLDRAVNDASPEPNDSSHKMIFTVRGAALYSIIAYWPSHPLTLPFLMERAENDPTPWLRKQAKKLIKELTEKKKQA